MISEAQEGQLTALLDESACRSLLERYTYTLDWLNWSNFEALFWQDATFDYPFYQGDRAGFMTCVAALEEPFLRRLHMFAAPRIELLGATRARIEAGAVIHLRSATTDEVGTDVLAMVRYQFHAEKREEEWRLSMGRAMAHGSYSFAGDSAGTADNLTTTHPWFAQ